MKPDPNVSRWTVVRSLNDRYLQELSPNQPSIQSPGARSEKLISCGTFINSNFSLNIEPNSDIADFHASSSSFSERQKKRTAPNSNIPNAKDKLIVWRL